jgi:hypothetical protein
MEKEQETSLETHEKMYENRLERIKLRNGKTRQELISHANDPRYYRKSKGMKKAKAKILQ